MKNVTNTLRDILILLCIFLGLLTTAVGVLVMSRCIIYEKPNGEFKIQSIRVEVQCVNGLVYFKGESQPIYVGLSRVVCDDNF